MIVHIEKERTARYGLTEARSNALRAYKNMTVGSSGPGYFLLYELVNFFLGSLQGGVGLALRRMAYPMLFASCKPGMIIGRNVTVRSPARIRIDRNVVIDDYALIDGRGGDPVGVRLEEGVIINRNCALKAKTGPITIGRGTNVGANSVIVSYQGVHIGKSVLISGGCNISAGGYKTDVTSSPMAEKGVISKGPIIIGDDVWIGTGAIILDGTTIGSHAVIGAGAVVTRDIGEYEVAAGVPARIMKKRMPEKR